ncbi:hypothetical protein RY966_004919 [Enterobacter kobei]|nr:hypothetical protein [Enterobacter kobei]
MRQSFKNRDISFLIFFYFTFFCVFFIAGLLILFFLMRNFFGAINMCRVNNLFAVFFMLVIFPFSVMADAHLKFHMAYGSGGTAYIGGTIGNSDSQIIHRGAIGFITVSATCEVTGIYSALFGPVPGREDVSFKIPVNASGFHGYRLAFFQAYDADGFPLAVTDDTAKIIAGREKEVRDACKNGRGK